VRWQNKNSTSESDMRSARPICAWHASLRRNKRQVDTNQASRTENNHEYVNATFAKRKCTTTIVTWELGKPAHQILRLKALGLLQAFEESADSGLHFHNFTIIRTWIVFVVITKIILFRSLLLCFLTCSVFVLKVVNAKTHTCLLKNVV